MLKLSLWIGENKPTTLSIGIGIYIFLISTGTYYFRFLLDIL